MVYVSKVIMIVEKKYNQIEREVFGVVCVCEYFSLYFYGFLEFIVIMDYKFFEKIWIKIKLIFWIK